MPITFSGRFARTFLLAFLWMVSPLEASDLLLEQDAHGLGMGGAVAALTGGTHSVYWNPAGIARATVPMGQVGGLYQPDPGGPGFNTVLLYPSRDQAVFGLSQFTKLGTADTFTVIMASLGMPLNPTRNLLFGVNVKHITLSEPNGFFRQKGRGLGLDFGLIYDLHLPKGPNVLSFALAVKDLSTQLRFSGTGEESMTRTIVMGTAFQNPNMRGELDYEIVDPGFSGTALHHRLKAGVERFFRKRNYSARAGYDDVLGNGGHFSVGAGYHPSGPWEINYAILLDEKTSEFTHAFSAVYRMDRWFRPREDRTEVTTEIDLADGKGIVASQVQPGSPVADVPLKKRELSLSSASFSPNGDGTNDAVTLILSKARPGEVGRWELAIQSENGKLENHRGGTGDLPESLPWKGVSDQGISCPDGPYRMVLKTFDEAGHLLSEDLRRVEIATGKASLSLRPLSGTFSPERGAKRATWLITAAGLAEKGSWEFEVVDASGRQFFATRGQGRPPKRIEWTGRDAQGASAPDGTYRCRATGQDREGNRVQSDEVRISLDRTAPEMRVKLPAPWTDFAKTPRVRIGLESSERNTLAEWRLAMTDDRGREIRNFAGRGNAPAEIAWDGTNGKGVLLSPGAFVSLKLTGVDIAGNMGFSEETGLQLEMSPPSSGEQLTLNLTTVFFPKDSSVLTEEGKRELNQAVVAIKPYLNKSMIVLRGYSSDEEIGDRLLLSRKRAVSARDLLAEMLGVPEERMVALGLANRDPQQTSTGPAPAEKQRRVVVTLYTQP